MRRAIENSPVGQAVIQERDAVTQEATQAFDRQRYAQDWNERFAMVDELTAKGPEVFEQEAPALMPEGMREAWLDTDTARRIARDILSPAQDNRPASAQDERSGETRPEAQAGEERAPEGKPGLSLEDIGKSEEELLSDMGISAEHFANAQASGATSVPVDLVRLAARFKGDQRAAIFDSLRMTPDGPTGYEARNFDVHERIRQAGERIKKIRDDNEKTSADVRKEATRLRDEMVLAGVARHVAEANVTLLTEHTRALAERYGLDPVEEMQRISVERGRAGEDGGLFQPTSEEIRSGDEALRRDAEAFGAELDKVKAAGVAPSQNTIMLNQTPLVLRLIGQDAVTGKQAAEGSLYVAPHTFENALAGRHGVSPYRFDKFTLDHIGSGEGAQVYGWGLYFAGEKAVAEHYREKLSRPKLVYKDGTKIDRSELNADESMAYDSAVQHGVAQALRNEKKLISIFEGKGDKSSSNAALARLEFLEQLESGQLYKVNIPENHELLDWDKPLSEQSEQVKEALRRAADSMPDDEAHANMSEWLHGILEEGRDLTGKQLYTALESVGVLDEGAYNSPEGERAAARAVSEYLNSFGIKGNRYLDGSSRGKGEGSHNYVIFDDAAIDTLKTYYQNGPRGAVELTPKRAAIRLFESADLSTLPHESAHVLPRHPRYA